MPYKSYIQGLRPTYTLFCFSQGGHHDGSEFPFLCEGSVVATQITQKSYVVKIKVDIHTLSRLFDVLIHCNDLQFWKYFVWKATALAETTVIAN